MSGDYLTEPELRGRGIGFGKNFQLHRLAHIVNAHKLSVGDDVRIDAFTVITCGHGGVSIGDKSHISSHVLLVAGERGIKMGFNTNIAAGGKIYAASDDFSGKGLIGSTMEMASRYIREGEVVMENYSCVGVNSVMMPGTILKWGSVLLANSVLTGDSIACAMMSGVPAKMVKMRDKAFIAYTKDGWAERYLASIDEISMNS